MKKAIALAAVTLAALSAAAASMTHAQSSGMGGMEMKGMDMKSTKKAESQVHNGSGTVTNVNPQKGTVSIAHGAIPSLNWPAMTMTFKVANREILETLKQGSKVDFSFVQSGRDYTITSIK